DILVNNASAIWLRGTLETPMKRFDLMQQVNARGSFLCAQQALPHLLKSDNPHILTLAPPPSLEPKWWGPHLGYTLAKMGMSFVTLGLAAEFGPRGVAVNALWPRTVIATDALNMIPGVDPARCRRPEIMADAAHAVLTAPARELTGRFLIDEDVLRGRGVGDFDRYAVQPGQPLLPGLFLGDPELGGGWTRWTTCTPWCASATWTLPCASTAMPWAWWKPGAGTIRKAASPWSTWRRRRTRRWRLS